MERYRRRDDDPLIPRALVPLLALLTAGCARTLRDVEWTQPNRPDAACTARITRTDALGRWTSEHLYDREGHLLFGTLRPTIDGRGHEALTWQNDRLVRVETFIEQDARELPCDVIGGCDTPRTRTREQLRLDWDGSRLVRVGSEKDTWVLTDEVPWRHRGSEDHSSTYQWKDGRLVGMRSDRGPVTFEYDEHGRLVRRTFKEGRRYTHVSQLEWNDGHVATMLWSGYTQTLSYEEGRLIRDELTREDRPEESRVIEWHYDPAGRLYRRTETRRPGRDRFEWKWEYDDQGRLVTTRDNGGVEERVYSGDCAPGLGAPRPPNPLELSYVGACVTSPGHLYEFCVAP